MTTSIHNSFRNGGRHHIFIVSAKQNKAKIFQLSKLGSWIFYFKGEEMYYNYHAKAKELINSGHLVKWEIVEDWNGIKPALVLHFDNNRSMPIRQHRWDEYKGLI